MDLDTLAKRLYESLPQLFHVERQSDVPWDEADGPTQATALHLAGVALEALADVTGPTGATGASGATGKVTGDAGATRDATGATGATGASSARRT